jgi:hypothetical protein
VKETTTARALNHRKFVHTILLSPATHRSPAAGERHFEAKSSINHLEDVLAGAVNAFEDWQMAEISSTKDRDVAARRLTSRNTGRKSRNSSESAAATTASAVIHEAL